jgi:NADH dehydrogenase FAD-containing subunit
LIIGNSNFNDDNQYYQFGKKFHVVIVGGGFAGVHLARNLDLKLFEVTLITKKTDFENIPTIPSFISDLDVTQIRSPYKNVCERCVLTISFSKESILFTKK